MRRGVDSRNAGKANTFLVCTTRIEQTVVYHAARLSAGGKWNMPRQILPTTQRAPGRDIRGIWERNMPC